VNSQTSKRIGIARALNKSGIASRSACETLVREGRVTCNGKLILDPEFPTTASDKFIVDGKPLACAEKVYLALNKPRGLVTSANDEKGRETVYRCLDGLGLGHVGPVGRLDKASEGLLFFTNDTEWANALLDPKRGLVKRYHVKWNGTPSDSQIAMMQKGIQDDGETLRAKSVRLLRTGPHSCWLEIELQEGKNREIRRMGAALGFQTLRLVRVAFGTIELGDLAKGAVRRLGAQEVTNLLRSS
jgi:23S rRNA pseudouridine2605 synthase